MGILVKTEAVPRQARLIVSMRKLIAIVPALDTRDRMISFRRCGGPVAALEATFRQGTVKILGISPKIIRENA